MNIKLRFAALLIPLSLILYSCDSDDDDDVEANVPFSLGVSDAFVDDAEEVNIEIDEIRIIPGGEDDDEDSSDTIVIDTFNGNETIKVNLLDYQGSDQLTIVTENDGYEVPVGTNRLELVVIDEGSYVILIDDPEPYDIKVPSSRLRLGEFDVLLGASETLDAPAYTIEFDLTKSLVLRGNDPAKNGFIIKPHGVRIVSNVGSGTIAGVVDMDAFMNATVEEGNCSSTDNTVYLYKDNVVASESSLVDMADTEDPGYSGDLPPEGSIQPFATTAVTMNDDNSYSYEFGFVPNGYTFEGGEDEAAATYTVAFSCGTGVKDNPLMYDTIMIPNPGKQLKDVIVPVDGTIMLDFPLTNPE